MIRKTYLHYDREKKVFVSCNDSKDRVNKQSTYLYDFLNGFGGDNIKWKDAKWGNSKDWKSYPRQNVFKYDIAGNILYDKDNKKIKDTRPWSFTRLDEIEKIPD